MVQPLLPLESGTKSGTNRRLSTRNASLAIQISGSKRDLKLDFHEPDLHHLPFLGSIRKVRTISSGTKPGTRRDSSTASLPMNGSKELSRLGSSNPDHS